MKRKRKEKCPQCGKSSKLLKSHITKIHPMQQTAVAPVNSSYDNSYAKGYHDGARDFKQFVELLLRRN